MTDNRFSDCDTPEEVLWGWRMPTHHQGSDPASAIAEALARIRELTPPEKPAVSEEARERAVSAVLSAMREAQNMGPDIPSANRWLDRIIDALGYTVEDCDNCGNQKCMKCYRNFPHEEDECANDCPECCPAENAESLGNLAPAPPPVVEINPTALQHIRVAMSAHSVVSDAMGQWPDFGDVPDIPISTEIPMRITLNDNGVSVLRIGGEQ